MQLGGPTTGSALNGSPTGPKARPDVKLRRVGILLHPTRDPSAILAVVTGWARRHSITTVAAGYKEHRTPPDVESVAIDDLGDADMLLAAGGDGTILHALQVSAAWGIPLLAVSAGRLGYLGDVETSRLDEALELVAHGRYLVEPRPGLELRHLGGETALAFNDVTLRRASGATHAAISLRIDDDLLTSYDGDGVIVATAAGSTGYSFSAGGPIVSPALPATVVTPLAPHSCFNRSLVLDSAQVVRIDLRSYSSALSIEVDGEEHRPAEVGDQLCFSTSSASAYQVRVGPSELAARIRHKLLSE